MSRFSRTIERLHEAIASAHRAVELDPLSANFVDSEGRILYRAHQYVKAIECYRRALELDPTFRPSFARLAEAYEMTGDFEQALAILEKIRVLGGGGGSPQRAFGSGAVSIRYEPL